jgi:hypothetical protein
MAFVNVPGIRGRGNPLHSNALLDRLRATGKGSRCVPQWPLSEGERKATIL